MTEEEMLIRARNAVAAEWRVLPGALADDNTNVRAVVRALRDLDKPVPDPDEEWRDAADAYYRAGTFAARTATPLDSSDRRTIAGLKVARSLMPKEG